MEEPKGWVDRMSPRFFFLSFFGVLLKKKKKKRSVKFNFFDIIS